MLLGVVHHLQDNSPLARHSNAAHSRSLLKPAGCLGSIEALPGGNPVGR
jgi:hypothetical protein